MFSTLSNRQVLMLTNCQLANCVYVCVAVITKMAVVGNETIALFDIKMVVRGVGSS